MTGVRAAVAGQLARDLVLLVDRLPDGGSAADVRLRREMLGGKGANQAVALAQLGVPVTLVAVAGTDDVADRLLGQARRDGVNASAVVRRPGAPTALIVDMLEDSGRWRYLQHIPEEMTLTEDDVAAQAAHLAGADAVLVQLQQPAAAALAAARLGREGGALVVLDGAPGDDASRDALLGAADVLRADAHETRLLTGVRPCGPEALGGAAAELLAAGPSLVVLALEDGGNLFAWPGGELALPVTDDPVVDTTGAGDALTAALTAALLRGAAPAEAARFAVAAAGATVDHPGGRPDLAAAGFRDRLAALMS